MRGGLARNDEAVWQAPHLCRSKDARRVRRPKGRVQDVRADIMRNDAASAALMASRRALHGCIAGFSLVFLSMFSADIDFLISNK